MRVIDFIMIGVAIAMFVLARPRDGGTVSNGLFFRNVRY